MKRTVTEKGEREREREGRGWKYPELLYTDGLVQCDELEEDLKVMVGRFVEVCKSQEKSLKLNADKSKMMMLGGEEELVCAVRVDGMRLEHMSKFI